MEDFALLEEFCTAGAPCDKSGGGHLPVNGWVLLIKSGIQLSTEERLV